MNFPLFFSFVFLCSLLTIGPIGSICSVVPSTASQASQVSSELVLRFAKEQAFLQAVHLFNHYLGAYGVIEPLSGEVVLQQAHV